MEIRVATLLSCIGSDAMNIFDGLTMTDSERKQIPEIFKAFEKYCVGETNKTYLRFIFKSRNQQEGKTVEKYIAKLRRLSKSCNFENLEDNLIQDKSRYGCQMRHNTPETPTRNKSELDKSYNHCKNHGNIEGSDDSN